MLFLHRQPLGSYSQEEFVFQEIFLEMSKLITFILSKRRYNVTLYNMWVDLYISIQILILGNQPLAYLFLFFFYRSKTGNGRKLFITILPPSPNHLPTYRLSLVTCITSDILQWNN